jgi:exonuclease SbcD
VDFNLFYNLLKILHTADWHLGKKLEHFSRLPEQKEVLREICAIADREQVDAVIIAGDLFDAFNPPTEAVELFYRTLKKLSRNGKRAVIAIAGNHDSPERIEAPNPLARECGIIFAGYPHTCIAPFKLDTGLEVLNSEEGFVEIKLPGKKGSLRLLLTPYANEQRLKTFLNAADSESEMRALLEKKWENLAQKYCDDQGVNILITHLFVVKKGEQLPEESEDEKPILHVGGAQAVYSSNIPKQMQYVALGHLHGKRVMAEKPCPMVYSSSILAYSMSEAEQEKYVILLEAVSGKEVNYQSIPLRKGKKLVRKKFEEIEEAVLFLQKNPDVFVELTIVSDIFLKAEDRQRLYAAHAGIVAIIPEIKSLASQNHPVCSEVNLSKNIEELFIDYFKFKQGQVPEEEVVSVFREMLGGE